MATIYCIWQKRNAIPESKVRKSVLRGRRPAPLFSKWQTCVRVLGPMSRSRTSKRHAKRINLPLQIYLNFAFQKNIFCSFHRLFVVFLVRRHRKREPHNKIKWTCGQNNVTGRKSEFNPLPNNIRWPLWHHTMYVIAQNSISHLLPFSLSIAIFNKSGSATTAAAYIFIFLEIVSSSVKSYRTRDICHICLIHTPSECLYRASRNHSFQFISQKINDIFKKSRSC